MLPHSFLPHRTLVRVVYLAALLSLCEVTSVNAQVRKTWTGGAGDGKWETGGNWNPPGVPAAKDTVVIPANSGTVKTNGGEKTIAKLWLEPSGNGPPPPTVLTSNDPPTSSVKITCTDAIFVGYGSKIRGQDPTQPNQPGGNVILKGGKAVVIDGAVEGGDSSPGSLFHLKGGSVTCSGGKVGSVNGGTAKGGKGTNATGNGPGGDGGDVTITGDGIKGTRKLDTEGGEGGTGNPPGKHGTPKMIGHDVVGFEMPGAMRGDSVVVWADDPSGSVDLSSLAYGSIVGYEDVVIVSMGLIDLRGNPAGVPIILAGHSITVCGSVLLDPGVTLESITYPPAIQSCGSTLAVGPDDGVDFALGHPFPNPARSGASIPFALQHDAAVRLAIYDLRGARVRTLLDARLSAGEHHAVWDGRDDSGRPVAPGMLFVKLDANGGVRTRTLLRVR